MGVDWSLIVGLRKYPLCFINAPCFYLTPELQKSKANFQTVVKILAILFGSEQDDQDYISDDSLWHEFWQVCESLSYRNASAQAVPTHIECFNVVHESLS